MLARRAVFFSARCESPATILVFQQGIVSSQRSSWVLCAVVWTAVMEKWEHLAGVICVYSIVWAAAPHAAAAQTIVYTKVTPARGSRFSILAFHTAARTVPV